MSGEFDHYLSRYYSQNTRRLQWNAAAAFEHHGRCFPTRKNAAILEIGPGTGALLGFLRDHCGYQNIRAIDVSPEVVAACNKILPGSTELVEDSAAFLQQQKEQFDLVLMLHTLEHIPKDQILPLSKAVRNALKPEGKFVVEVPNSEHPIVGTRNRYCDFTHTLGFTDLSLAFVLQNAGFSEIEIYPCKVPRRSLGRLIQRAAQDTVEMLMGLAVRLYKPSDHLILSNLLGACAKK